MYAFPLISNKVLIKYNISCYPRKRFLGRPFGCTHDHLQISRQEFIRSPMHDIQEFVAKNGKMFPTDPQPLASSLSPSFPSIFAADLNGKMVKWHDLFRESRVTAISISSCSAADVQIEPLRQHCRSRQYPLIDAHVTISWLKWILFGYFAKRELRNNNAGTRTFVMRAKHGVFGDVGAWNQYGGYFYLVDGQGRARWRTSGRPDENELNLLDSAVNKLIKECT